MHFYRLKVTNNAKNCEIRQCRQQISFHDNALLMQITRKQTLTDYKILLYCFDRLYSVVGVIPKEGLAIGGAPGPDIKICFLVMHALLQPAAIHVFDRCESSCFGGPIDTGITASKGINHFIRCLHHFTLSFFVMYDTLDST